MLERTNKYKFPIYVYTYKIIFILTIKPFGIIFHGAFEIVFLPTGCEIIQIRTEYNRISLGKFSVCARILQTFEKSKREREKGEIVEKTCALVLIQ